MEQSTTLRRLGWVTVVLLVAVVLSGCRRSGPQPSDEQQKQQAAKPDTQPGVEPKTERETEPPKEPGAEPPAEPGFRPPREPDVVPPAQPDVEPPAGPEVEPPGFEPPIEPPPAEPDIEPPAEPDVGPPPEPGVGPPPEPPVEPAAEKTPDLGPPLVDDPESLKRLDPLKPVWVDQKNGRVVMVGQVCQTEVPLEMFACLKDTKEHEAIVTVDVEAFKVHAGLLAIGAEPGHPVKFDPEYAPATGTEIEVMVSYKDKEGTRQTVRAQEWILDIETNKPMAHPWVFAGSAFYEDEETGQKYYQAEGGDFICVSNFSTAMLDLPIQSSQANSALLFKANTERIPPRGTPVTLVLTPKREKQEEKKQ